MNEAELISRLHQLEGKQYAHAVFAAQLAAYLPAPDVLLAHLAEDSEVNLLFRAVPEAFREQASLELRGIYELALGLHRGIAELALKRIPDA